MCDVWRGLRMVHCCFDCSIETLMGIKGENWTVDMSEIFPALCVLCCSSSKLSVVPFECLWMLVAIEFSLFRSQGLARSVVPFRL